MYKKILPLFILLLIIAVGYPGDNPLMVLMAHKSDEFTRYKPYSQNETIKIPYVDRPIPYVSAESIMITHAPTFTVIAEKNAKTKRYPASTLKMLTALTAKKLYSTNLVATIKLSTPEGQIIGLSNNEKMTVENLLYASLIYSGNDAAEALSNVSNHDNFLQSMRYVASELGMKDTTVKNPTGLDDDEQLTTAFDLTLLARAILSDEYLSRMISIKEIVVPNANFSKYYTLTNTNTLLGTIAGIGGVKTGYTEKAGQNLISYYIYNNEPYIITVLKSSDRFGDTKIITDWIQQGINFKEFNYN